MMRADAKPFVPSWGGAPAAAAAAQPAPASTAAPQSDTNRPSLNGEAKPWTPGQGPAKPPGPVAPAPQVQLSTPPPAYPQPTPSTTAAAAGLASSNHPPASHGASGQPPLFYDTGKMIRPQDQPFFHGHPTPFVPVQVGRVGSIASTAVRAAHQQPFVPSSSASPPMAVNAAPAIAPLTPPVATPEHPRHVDPASTVSDVLVPAAATPEKPAVREWVPPPDYASAAAAAVPSYPDIYDMRPTEKGIAPLSTEEANIFNTLERLHRPVVVLVVGGRGSGKSTQSRAIALKYGFEHLCSGDVVRAGGNPLVVLETVLESVSSRLKAEQQARKKGGKGNARPNPKAAAKQSATTITEEGAAVVDAEAPKEEDAAAAAAVPSTASSASNPYPAARRGIVLDRYMNNAEADPYYLIEALHRHGLQLDLIVNLMMPYEDSVARATERDAAAPTAGSGGMSVEPTGSTATSGEGLKAKPKRDQRRLQEHLAVWRSCTEVYEPYGGLCCIDVEDKSIEEVEHQVHLRVDRTIVGVRAGAAGSRRKVPEPPALCPGVVMNTRYSDFLEARNRMHAALGTPENKYGHSPASLMTGIVDRNTIEKSLRRFLQDYHVTWKADGQRLIVVRDTLFGFIAFTAKFSCFYVIDSDLIPAQWHALPDVPTPSAEAANGPSVVKPSAGGPEESVDPLAAGADDAVPVTTHVFDTELVCMNNGRHRLFVFDLLLSVSDPAGILPALRRGKPLKGADLLWSDRYATLRLLCQDLASPNSAWGFVSLKEFRPCQDIGSLVASPPSFPTDGIVFQHKGIYKIPIDTRIFKWKPQAQCSVDFRLSGGVEEGEDKRWLFYPLVLRYVDRVADEVAFKTAIVSIDNPAVMKDNLSDGCVVECIKTEQTTVIDGVLYEIWEYLRPRPDKAFPNQEAIAEQIDRMDHLSITELVELCRGMTFVQSGTQAATAAIAAAGTAAASPTPSSRATGPSASSTQTHHHSSAGANAGSSSTGRSSRGPAAGRTTTGAREAPSGVTSAGPTNPWHRGAPGDLRAAMGTERQSPAETGAQSSGAGRGGGSSSRGSGRGRASRGRGGRGGRGNE